MDLRAIQCFRFGVQVVTELKIREGVSLRKSVSPGCRMKFKKSVNDDVYCWPNLYEEADEMLQGKGSC